MPEKATLKLNDKNIDLDILIGSENEKAIDIRSLRAKTGFITLDPGYKNTGACTSEITFLDGEKGILRHRGYDIDELASKASFLEVVYLLVFEKLPTSSEFNKFRDDIKEVCEVDKGIKAVLNGFPSTAHPMGVLASLTGALIAFNPSSVSVTSSEDMYYAIVKLIAKFPTLVAWIHRKKEGLDLVSPNKDLPYIDNLAEMMFSESGEKYTPNPIIIDTLNKLLILHADHEQNCSTSTVRIVGSSLAGLFASISSGISALWGSLHGGANQAVIEMLNTIQNDGGNTEKYLSKAKDKNDPFRLMGFGHRVYKNFDPRAKIIKKSAEEVLANLSIKDPVLDIAKSLEQEALKDSYFVERKLYPNVDFYSGIIYRALGIPTDMFTVMFAMGRLPGWIAQWKEMRLNNEPIGRPRQLYTGMTHRKYVSMNERE